MNIYRTVIFSEYNLCQAFKDAKTYYCIVFNNANMRMKVYVYVILFMMKISEKINEMKRYDLLFVLISITCQQTVLT